MTRPPIFKFTGFWIIGVIGESFSKLILLFGRVNVLESNFESGIPKIKK